MGKIPFEVAKQKAGEMADKSIEKYGYPPGTTSRPVFKNKEMHRAYSEIIDKNKAQYREYLIRGFLVNKFGYTPNGDAAKS